MPSRKSTVKTPVGALRPQPHGGALRNGGSNKGGSGRPPSAVRETARMLYDERLPMLAAIADNTRVTPGERIRAISELGRVGMGAAISREDVFDRLKQQLERIRDWCAKEDLSGQQLHSLVSTIGEAWR